MKLAILLSGGKDSLYSAYIAKQTNELTCAITIKSKNKESYMYHTPNIDIVNLQAESMKIPLITKITKGEKEKELDKLSQAIKEAKEKFGIQGVITGAVGSQYQASRVQKICAKLDLYCINPLWQQDQIELLNELIENDFEVIIGGIFAYPFKKTWLGKTINKEIISKLIEYQKKYQINPAGEGGEIETMVLDCPLFSKRVSIKESKISYDNYAGTYDITKAELVDKENNKNKKYSNKKIESTGEDVLVISTINKSLEVYELEFLRPLTDLIAKANKKFLIKHISEITGDETQQEIIISGAAYQDNEFLKYKNNISKLIEKENKKVLGICAGLELILPEECELESVDEIGPIIVEELNKDKLTENLDGKECYFVHQKGIKTIPFNTNKIKAILATQKGIAGIKFNNKKHYGLQFHPEVNHKKLIIEFLK